MTTITPETLERAVHLARVAYKDSQANTNVIGNTAVGQQLIMDEALTAAILAALPELLAAQQQPDADTRVNGGALRMALNVLRRAGKHEVADALEATAIRQPANSAGGQLAFGRVNGYLPDARAVEVVLDGAVPEWITKLPTGVCLASAAVAAEAAPQAVDLREKFPGLVRALEKIVRTEDSEPIWIEVAEAAAILASCDSQQKESSDAQ
jgi:hypothetical protein